MEKIRKKKDAFIYESSESLTPNSKGEKNASKSIDALFRGKQMKCEKIQHWLSDSVDGEIQKGKKADIDAHLDSCPSCRAFLDQITQIDEEARSFDVPGLSPMKSGEFASRLKSAISELEEKSEGGILHVFRKKWIFVPASVFLLSLFILTFVFYEKRDFKAEEVYVFSLGKVVEEIYQVMGNDLVLEEAFHSLLSASINKMLITADWDERLNSEDDLFLWEEFSEEELEILEQEIKRDNNS
jgi:hypothetical protein